jgi:biopolymer transport protein ExbD
MSKENPRSDFPVSCGTPVRYPGKPEARIGPGQTPEIAIRAERDLMRLAGLLAVGVFAFVLASGCGKPPATERATTTERPGPTGPQAVPEPAPLPKPVTPILVVSVAADGRTTLTLRKTTATLKETSKPDAPKTPNTAQLLPEEAVTLRVRADEKGQFKTVSVDRDGKVKDFGADTVALEKHLRAEWPQEQRPELRFVFDGRLKYSAATKLLDLIRKAGFATLGAGVEWFERPLELPPLGAEFDRGEKPADLTPTVALEIHPDAPYAAVDRVFDVLKAWRVLSMVARQTESP